MSQQITPIDNGPMEYEILALYTGKHTFKCLSKEWVKLQSTRYIGSHRYYNIACLSKFQQSISLSLPCNGYFCTCHKVTV